MEREEDKEEQDETEVSLEPQYSQSSIMLCTKKQVIMVGKRKAVLPLRQV